MKKIIFTYVLSLLLLGCEKNVQEFSIGGTYDNKSQNRGSELDVIALPNNSYSAHINAYYQFGKIEDGMVNICDIEGILKPISEKSYLLSDEYSSVILTFTNTGVNVVGVKIEGCGQGVEDSVVGNYVKVKNK